MDLLFRYSTNVTDFLAERYKEHPRYLDAIPVFETMLGSDSGHGEILKPAPIVIRIFPVRLSGPASDLIFTFTRHATKGMGVRIDVFFARFLDDAAFKAQLRPSLRARIYGSRV